MRRALDEASREHGKDTAGRVSCVGLSLEVLLAVATMGDGFVYWVTAL